MTRSLVFKTAAYATIVFFLAVPATVFVARKVFETGRRFDAPAFVLPTLAFLERELEREWQGAPPTRERLAEFEGVSRHSLRFVAWGDPAIPPGLAEADRVVDGRAPGSGVPPRHWARIDHGGQPVGALEMVPRFHRGPGGWGGPGGAGGPPPGPPPGRPGPGFRGPFAPDLAWIWLLTLMLIIVPPLFLWVLRPLREMVGVAQRLGAGDLDTPVPIDRRDEFGELERAFEKMRLDLKGAFEQRERLLTDVSHEIRGPLARMMIALPLLRQEGAPGPVTQIFENELRAVDELVGDVLALARGGYQDRMAWTRLDLAAIARARVEDDGPGIAPEHLPHVFEPFWRPDTSRSRETGGAGLGLSIVKRIAEGHGGSVGVTSRPGGGTIAELRLPSA